MNASLALLAIGAALGTMLAMVSALLSSALRDYSHGRLEECLKRRHRAHLLEPITQHLTDLIFLTGLLRLLGILLTVVCLIALTNDIVGLLLSIALLTAFTVALPTAVANHAGEPLVAAVSPALNALRVGLWPLTAVMHAFERLAHRVLGPDGQPEPEQIDQDILSVVEEGEKEGLVDTQERRMIESVIEFRDTDVAQTMTGRPEIKAIEIRASLDEVRRLFEQTGHSRLPIYDGTIDHIVGILHARDLLKQVGQPAEDFDLRKVMRPAIFVPETKPLKELLVEFRIQKGHIAIVLDEYGGTSGLVTIEDILEELVGEISDEHEPQERATLRKTGPGVYDVDARLHLDEVNRILHLDLPEDTGVNTLGGWVSTTLGRIPQKGAVFEHNGIRFEVLDAAPQLVKRLKIEMPNKIENAP